MNPFLLARRRPTVNRSLVGGGAQRQQLQACLPSVAMPVLPLSPLRATTATDLLKHEVPREQVQYLLGHSDARTTGLYNRTDKEVSSNIVERIFI